MKRGIAFILAFLMAMVWLPVSAQPEEVLFNTLWSNCDTGEGWQTESSRGTLSVSSECGYSGSVQVVGASEMFFFSWYESGNLDITDATCIDFWFYTSDANIFKRSSDCGFNLSYTSAWESGGVGVNKSVLRNLNLQEGWNHLTLPLDFSGKTPDCDLTKIQRFRFYAVGLPSSPKYTVRIDEVRFANQAGLDNADKILANQVVEQIEKIGTVNQYSAPYIKAAREAYNALTDVAKGLVENYQTLVDAEEAYGNGTYDSTALPTDMATKLDVAIENPDWVITACDKTGAVYVDGGNAVSVVSVGEDKFTAFIPRGKGTTQVMTRPNVKITTHEMGDLALKMQLYVSDVTCLGVNSQLELTSSGTCDSKELNWSLDAMGLKNGWNNVYLELSTGGKQGGGLDLSNINYMRMYFFPTKDFVMAIDNVRIVERMVPQFEEDFETEESLSKWQSESAMALDNGALKISGESEISVSTSAYKLYILAADRTPVEFDLKAADPAKVTALKVIFENAIGKKAEINLDVSTLTADKFAHFMVVPDEMTGEAGYDPEVIKTVTLVATLSGETDLWLDHVEANLRSGLYWRDWVYNYTTTPGEYSFVVIPDIQELTAVHPLKLNTVMQWIVNNKEKENIQFAIDVGDLTWNGHSGNELEFQVAARMFKKLQDAGLEYAIAYGNHDYQSGRDTSLLNKYFPLSNLSTFDSFGGVMTEGKVDNIYNCFEVQGNKYMVVSLEFDPSSAAIAWANKVIADHPDHQVILNTHNYMSDQYGERSAMGDTLWKQLVSKHKNIIMVLCGHECLPKDPGSMNYRVDAGENGNQVHQVMANSQDIDAERGGVGLLLMMRFRNGGKIVDLNYFSPVNDCLAYKPQNQFTFTVEIPESTPPLYGDANQDGQIGAADALEVLKAVVGKTQLSEDAVVCGDVDGDGKITATDALWILKKVVGKADRFPVEEE